MTKRCTEKQLNRVSQRREFTSRRVGRHWPGVAALGVSFGATGMKQALHKGLLASALMVCFSSHAQSNVYSLSIYSAGVSSSPIVEIGSWPKGLSVWRESYWTDSQGYVVMWAGSARGIQPTDKQHVETKLCLGRASYSVPLPPALLATFAAVLILALAFLAALGYTRRSRVNNEPHNQS